MSDVTNMLRALTRRVGNLGTPLPPPGSRVGRAPKGKDILEFFQYMNVRQ